MSITHKKTVQVNSSQSAALSGSCSEVGAAEVLIDQVFAASTVNQLVAVSFAVSAIQDLFLVADKGCTIRTNGTGTSEVQTLTVTGTPTGGTIPLAFNGAVTTVAYNASAATVQAALQALSTVGSGNVTCTGGPLPGTPVVCTFAGTLASKNVPSIATSSAGLTGGTSPAAAVSVTTPGLPADVITLVAGTPLTWSKSEGYSACPFTADVTAIYVSTSVASRLYGKVLTS